MAEELNKEEREEVEEIFDDIEGRTAQFEGEIWLSTDGKHTVRVKAETPRGRKIGGKWAFDLYQRLVEELGTKQAQAVREYSKENNKSNGKIKAEHICEQCGGSATIRSGVKNGKPWKGLFCNDKETCKHVEWL